MKSLAVFLAATLACSLAYAQTPPGAPKRFPWDQRPGKCFAPGGEEEAAASPMCRANDWPDYAVTKSRIDRLLADPDFDLLERAEREVGFSRERFATGEYLFDAWFLSLDQFFRYAGERGRNTAREWAAARGNDSYAPLAQAIATHAEGWNARGSGYGNTVSPEAWQIYRKKLEEADALLESSSPRLRQMGPWHMEKLRLAFESQQAKPAPITLLKTAAHAWPEYLPLYTVAMNYVSPKWGGSFEQVDAIARFALEQTRQSHGAAMYALAYERHLRLNPDSSHTLGDTAVDWELMKQAFRDVEARAKAPAWTARNFAGFACQMRDRDEARRLYALYDRQNPGAATETNDPCRSFATSP
jgi:hypothetical protein